MAKTNASLLDDGDDVDVGSLDFKVNESFAKRFEHNKRREELHRLQEKHPELAARLETKALKQAAKSQIGGTNEEEEEESSDDEDEDDGEISDSEEVKVLETLLKIRKKDPIIYQKDVKLFEEPEEGSEGGEEEGEGADKKKKKPVFLKDVIAKQALEYGAEGGSSDDEGDEKSLLSDKRNVKVYDVEQEQLRKAFLSAADEATEAAEDGFGGVLRKRYGLGGEEEAEGDEEAGEGEGAGASKKTKKKSKSKNAAPVDELLDEYFGQDEELDENDRFLKSFILNKGWVDKGDKYVPSYNEVVGDEGDEENADYEEDEQFLEQVDKFEAAYNFRYEEPGATTIVSHPRRVDDSIRKPDERRKAARDRKAQREAEMKMQQEDEIKRLKNLKKKEINDKLEKVQKVAGKAAPDPSAMDAILEGDFDPEKWDKIMASAFDDDYYNAEDNEGELFEDDLQDELGLGDADGADAAGFSEVRKKLASQKQEAGDDDDEDMDLFEEEEEGEEDPEKAEKRKKILADQRAALQRMLEAYYKLDYEDNIGGVKTRFRYKPVVESTFGLTPADILTYSDKELNQIVGMKRLAPYREDQHKIRPNYKALELITGSGPENPWANKGSKGGKQGGANFGGKGGEKQHSGQKRQQQDWKQQSQNKKQKFTGGGDGAGEGVVDEKAARLASYGKLGLKKEGGGHGGQGGGGSEFKREKRPEQKQKQQQEQQVVKDGPALTKAQRKNMKRAEKRAQKRDGGEAAQ